MYISIFIYFKTNILLLTLPSYVVFLPPKFILYSLRLSCGLYTIQTILIAKNYSAFTIPQRSGHVLLDLAQPAGVSLLKVISSPLRFILTFSHETESECSLLHLILPLGGMNGRTQRLCVVETLVE